MQWTDKRIALLKELWAEGVSASQIASRLGGVTRNGVIAQANRLGLEPRDAGGRYDLANRRRQANRIQYNEQPKFIGDGLRDLKVKPSDTPEAERVSLIDAKLDQCRWPYPRRMVCGRKTCRRGAGVYCKDHAARAYAGCPKHKGGHFVVGNPLSPKAARAPERLSKLVSTPPE